MQYGNIDTSITKVNHVRFNGAAILFQESVVGESAAKAPEKRQKAKPAGLARFQLRLDVNHAKFVGAGNANVRQLQTPAKRHIIGNVNCMAGEFRGIKVQAGFTSSVWMFVASAVLPAPPAVKGLGTEMLPVVIVVPLGLTIRSTNVLPAVGAAANVNV